MKNVKLIITPLVSHSIISLYKIAKSVNRFVGSIFLISLIVIMLTNKKKRKIFIDFDGTIFDTAGFRDQIYKLLRRYDFDDQEITRFYREECLDYKFKPNGLFERLANLKRFNLSECRELMNQLYDKVPDYIFPDTFKFLKGIDRHHFEVNLLSLGDPAFQRKKIFSSGLDIYFDNIYITELQKWDYFRKKKLVADDEVFYLIDDRSDTIFEVKKNFPRSIALEIDRAKEDKNDPVRSGKNYDNSKIRNFQQVFAYL